MIRLRAAAVVLLLAFTPVGAFAQTPAAKPAPTDAASGTITGKVIDERGQPLAGTVIYASAQRVRQRQSLSAITDREGVFKLTGLDPDSYSLSPSLPAYTSPLFDPTVQRPPTYHIGDSATLTLIKGGVITGTVTNLAGEP